MKIGEYIDAEIRKLERDGKSYIPDVIEKIAIDATQKYGHKVAIKHIGGFDNGSDLECYAFAYVEDGEVGITMYNYEY